MSIGTTDGDAIVWWGVGVDERLVGQQVSIRGRVKAHDTYKDGRQTVLTRCTVVPLDPAVLMAD